MLMFNSKKTYPSLLPENILFPSGLQVTLNVLPAKVSKVYFINPKEKKKTRASQQSMQVAVSPLILGNDFLCVNSSKLEAL